MKEKLARDTTLEVIRIILEEHNGYSRQQIEQENIAESYEAVHSELWNRMYKTVLEAVGNAETLTQPASTKLFRAVGISKTKSNLFNRYSYLLYIDDSHKSLLKGVELKYGYLYPKGFKGSEKGWFQAPVSVDREQFSNYWELKEIDVINPDKAIYSEIIRMS